MKRRHPALAFLVAVLHGATAAAQNRPAARVAGSEVTLAELDVAASQRLAKIRNAEYTVRRQALDGVIERRLLEAEAKAQGINAAELEKAAIAGKVEAVTPEQARAVYDAAPERYASMPQGQALAQITTSLQRNRLAQVRKEFLTGLRKKYGVEVFLEAPRASIDPGDGPSRGPKGAPVTMVIFSDYQCPYCLRVNPTLKSLETRYGTKLRFVFKDFPLGIHPDAQRAAEGGQCAATHGKFWEMHDKMFASQRNLQAETLKTFAREIGLDAKAFASCLDSGQTAPVVKASLSEGTRLGVTGTPSFFINGRFMTGAQAMEKFAEVIDDELGRTTGGR